MPRRLFSKKSDPTICSVPVCNAPRSRGKARLVFCDEHMKLYWRDPDALRALGDASAAEEDAYTAISHAGAFDGLNLDTTAATNGVILQPRTGRMFRVRIVDCLEDPALSYAAGLDALGDRVADLARAGQVFISD